MSAETSPLLPQSQGQAKPKSSDHHIFLRVCHTAWSFVGTETLLASRATIMTYMMVVWAYALKQEIAGENDARLFPFYIGNISYTLQTGYFMLATVSHIWSAAQLGWVEPADLVESSGPCNTTPLHGTGPSENVAVALWARSCPCTSVPSP
jgi:hypothetical protein